MLKIPVIAVLLLLWATLSAAVPAPPEGQRLCGTLIDYRQVEATALGIEPPMPLYVLTVAGGPCQDADSLDPESSGKTLEVLAKEPLEVGVLPRAIRAEVLTVGDEWGQRHWLQGVSFLP